LFDGTVDRDERHGVPVCGPGIPRRFRGQDSASRRSE
jgi:hypothetical protein